MGRYLESLNFGTPQSSKLEPSWQDDILLMKRCIDGFIHEGEAKGDIENLASNSAYLSYPTDRSTHNALLIFTDAMGHKFINSQLIADRFAAEGYFVVIPDLFQGHSLSLNQSEDLNFFEWLEENQSAHTDLIIETVIKELRDNLGCKRIGGVGFCLGSKYVCHFLKPGSLDAGFIAHPTLVELTDFYGINGPLSIAADDQLFSPTNRSRIEEVLKNLGMAYQINQLFDVSPNVYSRGDLSQPSQMFARDLTQSQAVQWFDHYLRERSSHKS